MPARPPFAEAVWHEVLQTSVLGYDAVVVLAVPPDSEVDAAITAAKAADAVPYDAFGGLWHIGEDDDGRQGISFHLIERGRGHSGLDRVWAVYEPPRSLVSAAESLPHLVALLPADQAGPADQPSVEIRARLAEALIVEVESHSFTMQRHLDGG